MIEQLSHSAGSALGFRVSGVVTKDDYEVLVPAVEKVVADSGEAHLLLDLTDLKWEKVDAWGSDLRFGRDYRDKVTRLAVVGDGFFQKIIAEVAKPFYAHEVQFFADQDTAWAWLDA